MITRREESIERVRGLSLNAQLSILKKGSPQSSLSKDIDQQLGKSEGASMWPAKKERKTEKAS